MLVIEDDPAQLMTYCHLVKRAGFMPLSANNAKEALDLIKKGLPQLILMDLSLPDLSGSQLLPCIRNLPHGRDIPIVIISASLGRIESIKSSDSHLDVFLHKPVDADELIRVIKHCLAK